MRSRYEVYFISSNLFNKMCLPFLQYGKDYNSASCNHLNNTTQELMLVIWRPDKKSYYKVLSQKLYEIWNTKLNSSLYVSNIVMTKYLYAWKSVIANHILFYNIKNYKSYYHAMNSIFGYGQITFTIFCGYILFDSYANFITIIAVKSEF